MRVRPRHAPSDGVHPRRAPREDRPRGSIRAEGPAQAPRGALGGPVGGPQTSQRAELTAALAAVGAVDTEMAKHDGYRNWDFNFRSEVYSAVFPRDRIVYLSAESEEVLEQLDPAAAYIIGGLVDHNHHKGLCHQRAVEAGVRTRAATKGHTMVCNHGEGPY